MYQSWNATIVTRESIIPLQWQFSLLDSAFQKQWKHFSVIPLAINYILSKWNHVKWGFCDRWKSWCFIVKDQTINKKKTSPFSHCTASGDVVYPWASRRQSKCPTKWQTVKAIPNGHFTRWKYTTLIMCILLPKFFHGSILFLHLC